MRAVCGALLFLVASISAGAPPDVPAVVKAKPGQLVRVVVKTDAEIGTLKNFTDADAFWGELVGPKGQRQFVFQAPADGARAEYVIGWWTKGETEGATTTITIESAAPPPTPPVPPAPGPGPNPPAPVDPLKSFRVMIVTGADYNWSNDQRAVIYGADVEKWLTANCTGGAAGWRRRQKDLPGDADGAFKDLWAAVQPKLTTVPCVVVQRNDKVDIIDLSTTPAKMIEALTAYRGK